MAGAWKAVLLRAVQKGADWLMRFQRDARTLLATELEAIPVIFRKEHKCFLSIF